MGGRSERGYAAVVVCVVLCVSESSSVRAASVSSISCWQKRSVVSCPGGETRLVRKVLQTTDSQSGASR